MTERDQTSPKSKRLQASPLVRADDFGTFKDLARQIADSKTFQAMTPSGFIAQAETLIARHSTRAYVVKIEPYLTKRLRRPSELKDRPGNDVLYMNLPIDFCYAETHRDMQKRQWFSDLKRGLTHNVHGRYEPLLSALGTVVAIHEPDTARRWNKVIAQRIAVWEAYDQRQSPIS